ncbi:TonB-dependent receptor plug domain-containing protein [Dyadobacter sp. BHUBP1]|uniref:TonB-dependent receptor plug domain-containing protein n=1 Tax=Dyadobacter sp. BHUBP1 TaxID=3424178 RepID=UPI003D348DB7
MKENASQLQEVMVSARNLNRENVIVAKMPLKKLENPQVYSTVSSEIMKQQGITSYDDVLRNMAGITRTWESTGRGGDGASYFALRSFEAQPLLYNGLRGTTSGNLVPSNVEEIQVIKGPSSTLFGGSFYGYGGVINTITRKLYHQFGGEIGYNAPGYGCRRHRLPGEIVLAGTCRSMGVWYLKPIYFPTNWLLRSRCTISRCRTA